MSSYNCCIVPHARLSSQPLELYFTQGGLLSFPYNHFTWSCFFPHVMKAPHQIEIRPVWGLSGNLSPCHSRQQIAQALWNVGRTSDEFRALGKYGGGWHMRGGEIYDKSLGCRWSLQSKTIKLWEFKLMPFATFCRERAELWYRSTFNPPISLYRLTHCASQGGA